MRKLKDYLLVGVKGACMGAADVIPGVSGGTIAFITGIYDEFVGSIARVDAEAVKLLFKGRIREFWNHINGWFILSIVLGIGTSVVALAGMMQMLKATQLEPKQRQLVQALRGFVPDDRLVRLEKAMQASLIAKFASAAMNQGGR